MEHINNSMNKSQHFDGRLIYGEQVKQLYKHMPIGVAATLVNSLIVTFVLWKVTPHVNLTIWLTACVLVSIFRCLLYLAYRRSSQEPAESGRHEMWFNLGMAVSGVVWGSAGIFLFPSDSIAHQSFIALVLGGMVAGAAGTFSVILRTFMAYSLPVLIPLSIRFFAAGDHIHLAMGVMTLLFGLLMFSTAKRVNTAIRSSLQLQFENRDLVRQLERRVRERTADLEKANENLKVGIERRKEAERALLELNENLEYRIRERTAELERKNQELQEFAFVASHDLNEPLRKIQTFGSLLESKAGDHLSDQEKGYISRMVGAASRMQELLEALLRYSRIATMGEELKPTRLNDVIQDVVSDLEVEIRKVRAQVDIGPLPTALGDPSQLRQCFQNLIANAVKYRRPDIEGIISIQGEENGGVCRIFVEDNGIGFDEKYLDKIFQPFQRLHGKDEYLGLGIGLAICKKIVERHGGTITARSTPGKGSTFIVTLPVNRKA
ncbi:MAG: hypothetical protein CVU64_07180 [Deltaproteobacteria bacterium HGW-Deltaproteobacteria-21]|nr:MAG: hypothetical protein CVU64_07180 [Deltaproteobacteria bacterium HGW-Deltaproteobacteria-21]